MLRIHVASHHGDGSTPCKQMHCKRALGVECHHCLCGPPHASLKRISQAIENTCGNEYPITESWGDFATLVVQIAHKGNPLLGSLKTLQAERWNVNMQSAMVAYLKPSERPASCHDANSCHDSIVALAILTGVSVAVAAGLRASGCCEGT